MKPLAEQSALRALHQVPLFSGLTSEELGFLVQRAIVRQYQPGEVIFQEGDPCHGLYVIQSGQVKIFKISPEGRELVLAIDGPGSSVAELPVFDGGSYPASAAAVSEAVLLLIGRDVVQQLCRQHPEVALKFMQHLGSRLRRLVEIIHDLSFATVRQRLAHWLLQQAQASGRGASGAVEFDLPGTHQELAARIGTVRELVSRHLSQLQAQGIIRIEGRRVRVLNLPELQKEATGK